MGEESIAKVIKLADLGKLPSATSRLTMSSRHGGNDTSKEARVATAAACEVCRKLKVSARSYAYAT
ncbi:hypothetical protein N7541_000994 [Penicillium brevicompactum]|uniref:Uncharacterized protein n=1 Tax=Penicillium brevicompactum TaxID=5074 RepID=A0A9W9RV87_PENBR|nr:hypothetical protein N7541_000994 [Penicillium brevicompactum]